MRMMHQLHCWILAAMLAGCSGGGSDALPPVVVYKTPACGCCLAWADHMRAAGFVVEVRDVNDLDAVRAEMGVPAGLGTCHTAQIGDYFAEGHVPADDIKRLLAQETAARGLVVPGMPVGSPGMEQGETRQPYDVLLVGNDGSTTVFTRHGE